MNLSKYISKVGFNWTLETKRVVMEFSVVFNNNYYVAKTSSNITVSKAPRVTGLHFLYSWGDGLYLLLRVPI
jgi:hypothetical protein